jgi:cyanophycinase
MPTSFLRLTLSVFIPFVAFATFTASAAPPAPKGTLVIVGGGERSLDVMQRFIQLAGGQKKARIAVLPMASEDAAEAGREMVAELDSMGARAYMVLLTRAEAETDAGAGLLDSATGIWFSGGDQDKLAAAIGGTAVLRAVHARYVAGAAVGGTSAGAAVMSDSMITGNQTPPGDTTGYYGDEFPAIARNRIQVVPGFGFLTTGIVDQHFIKRERHNRLLSAVLERPYLIGVGIDEGTALEVDPDGRWRVLGKSAVIVYDARKAHVTPKERAVLGATEIRLHVLPSGSTFDPKTGRGVLSP